MKNLSKFEMNAVVGSIGPKSSVAGGLGGISVQDGPVTTTSRGSGGGFSGGGGGGGVR